MTQLKDVYGIISFEQRNIKVSVFQIEKHAKHCLYFRNIPLHDDLNKHLKENRAQLLSYLKEKLMKVDSFIGVKVVRYLILVPDLKMSISNKLSDKFIFNDKQELDNYIKNLPTDKEHVCLNRCVTDYVVNEQVQSTFPANVEFRANYIEYLAKKQDIAGVVDLINELHIIPRGFYNNPIAYENSILNHNQKTRVLIDMLDDCTNIYFYSKETELSKVVTIGQGKNWFIDSIAKAIKLDYANALNLLASYKNIKNVSQNIAVCNYDKAQYRLLDQLDLNSFKKITNNQINYFFKLVVDACDCINAESIHFNCDSTIYDCFEYKLNKMQPIVIDDVKLETQLQNIVGLENDNTSNIIWILNGVINEKEILTKQVPCSIDAYFDEYQQEKQFNKDVFMKFGIFLTNFVAKLGGSMDSLWKK